MHPDEYHQAREDATGNASTGRLTIAHSTSSHPNSSTTTTITIVLTIAPISGAT
jgi:hypothetical protein